MSYRAAGVALVPALAVHGLLHWRAHRGRALIPVAFWGAAGIGAVLFYAPFLGRFGSMPDGAALVRRAVRLFESYRLAVFDAQLYPFARDGLNDAYHLVATLLMVVGLLVLGRRAGRSFLAIALTFYVVVLALAPARESRYLWPVFPVLAAATVVGLQRVVEPLTRGVGERIRRAALLSTFAAVLVGALAVALARPAPPSLVALPESRALFAWIDSVRAREPIRIAFQNPRVVTLETRAPAMGLLPRSTPGHLAAWVDTGITHFIWQAGPMASCVQRIANRVVQQYPDRFALDYENATFRVYRVLPGPAPGADEYTPIDWSDRERWCAADASEG
jgi:hypothetical protein